MRRTHLRGHENILKRQLIHVCAFNLSLIFRLTLGAGTPPELRNRQAELISALMQLRCALLALDDADGNDHHNQTRSTAISDADRRCRPWNRRRQNSGGCTTGC